MAIVSGSILFLLATFLLAIGWRGQRVGEHPVCPRCEFDLFGLPEQSERCPECGHLVPPLIDLPIGRRRVRWIPLFLGLLLGVISAVTFATWGVAAYQGERAVTWKPAWWLASDLVSSDRALSQGAIAELRSRIQTGRLSQSGAHSVGQKILDAQQDPQRPWDRALGDLMEAAREAHLLPAEDWSAFGSQAIQVNFKVRERIGEGEILTAETSGTDEGRTGRDIWFQIKGTIAFSIDGNLVQSESTREQMNEIVGCSGITSTTYYLPSQITANLPPGQHRLHAHINGKVISADDIRAAGQGDAEPIALRQVDLESTFIVLPVGQASVASDMTPATHDIVRDSVRINLRDVTDDGTNQQISMSLDNSPLPVGFSMLAFVRIGTREWVVDAFAYPAKKRNGRSCSWTLDRFHPNAADPLVVDVIFRPDPRLAEKTLDVFDALGTEIVYPNITVPRAKE